MAAREGPSPVVDVRHRDAARPGARLRRRSGAGWSAPRWRSHACASACCRRPPTSRRRRGSTTPTSTSTCTCDASPARSRARCDRCSTWRRSIVADPFDRTRPLWQFIVVEGLRGGKAALIQKMHHTITDGERGVELSLQYLDFERDAPEPPPIDPDRRSASRSRNRRPAETIRELLAGTMRIPIGIARQVRELLADPAGDPRRVDGGGEDDARRPQPALRHRGVALAAVGRAARCSAGSRRRGRRSGRRRTPPNVSAARSTRRSSPPPPTPPPPTTSRWAQPVESLRASMAISTRTDDSGSNAFTLARLLVPTERDADRRALPRHRRSDHGRARVDQGRRARHAGGGHDGAADVADHAARPPAGEHGRFRHVEREGFTGAGVSSPAPSCSRSIRSARSAASPSTSR